MSLPRRQAVTTARQRSGADGDLAGHLRQSEWSPEARGAVSATIHGGGPMETASGHLPVMLDRVVELLAPALQPAGAVLVDATLGRAGHARALLTAYPGLRLIGIDADATAIDESRRALTEFTGRVLLVQAIYDQLPQVLADTGHPSVQGVLFDL